ncbi:MAG: hypothetical protein SPK50_05325 [Mobiluncus porci]|uniref:Uncharacterized protein n=1 Tax=Mobiluncus porci TaxID=2652278 RepID=A0A7K0JZN7_9ACTO|nr:MULTISPECIES: hypothetical protein [Mobiluncus]MCI6584611.1 hypothetical protein [Mobiluncus sp.]MDD7541548.1 hypothetical protein [Mobiluncus porci]MDY5748533.1 hypothetical protein [Mobiluncus porci]MST48707.1 hypothetical protein [Mobiluncus porci]
MSEKTATVLRIAIGAVMYLLCIGLVVYGNTIPGWKGLGIMLLGLAGILIMLYLYNRRHK